MTGQDIVTAVRGKLQDDQFDSSLILQAANWFVNDLFSTTRTRLMETSDIMYPGAGDTSVDLPDDFQTLIWESLTVISPTVYQLKDYFQDAGAFSQSWPGYLTYTPKQLTYWSFFGNTMRFNAPLVADTQIAIDYLRRPDTMNIVTDTCEVPDAYMEMVVLGTLARCMQTNEDYGEATQELANLAPLRVTFIRNEARGQAKTGPLMMRTNRRRNGNIRNNGWS